MKIRNKEEFLKTNKFGVGNPNIAYSRYFTGSSFLKEQNLAGKNIYLFCNQWWMAWTY
ncbi:MAG: hypothetical protein MSA42_02175 [Mollicutes bacterium]|nr:hypothetical protein [Mollicutes bacterium]